MKIKTNTGSKIKANNKLREIRLFLKVEFVGPALPKTILKMEELRLDKALN